MAADGLSRVRARIAAAASRAGRDPAAVQLVVVTKNRTPEQIRALYDRGHRDFGENRAQELTAKAPLLPDDIRWHFVGSLQRNKVAKVRPLVVMLQSLDRLVLVEAWARAEGPPPVLLQVNVGGEEQKHGMAVAEVREVAAAAVERGLDVRGLMTVPPAVADPEAVRPFFADLANLRDELSTSYPAVTELSMGMTDDFGVAIEEGATIVRVGRAIFERGAHDGT